VTVGPANDRDLMSRALLKVRAAGISSAMRRGAAGVRRTVEDLELMRPGRRTEPAAWPYELAVEEPVTRRVAVAFDELALAI
jgi:hypothetical protein